MEIKTADGSKNVGSAGVSNAALSLGIVGTSLAVLNGANGGDGILGNIFGGNGGRGGEKDSRIIGALEAKIAELTSERYTDHAISHQRDRLDAVNEKLINYVIDIDKRVAKVETETPLLFRNVEQQIGCVSNTTREALNALTATVASITATVVPNSRVCPGWGDVTITPSTSTTSS